MQTRLATPGDAIALAELRWEHEFEGNPKVAETYDRATFVNACAEHLSQCLGDGTWHCWLTEDHGRIIANIFIKRIRKIPKPQKPFAEIGYVTNVHTRAEYRNQGVGTELLKKAVAWARDTGLEGLFVWPSDRSRPYYRRQGFMDENDVMELELE